MKFIDEAKIQVIAGKGGMVLPVSVVNDLSQKADQMAEMVAMAAVF